MNRQRNRWAVVVTAGLGVFMAQLDATIVNVALPAIGSRYGVGTAVVQWVMLGYTLPLLALVLPIGRWLESAPVRPVLIASVAGFSAGGLLASLAPGIGWLIAARVLQGCFGAALFVLLPVLATTAVTPAARGRAMGVVMTLGPLGGFSGPVLGGLLLERAGTGGVFLVNPLIGVLVAVSAFVLLPRGGRVPAPGGGSLAEAGLLLAAAGAVLMAMTLAVGEHPAWLVLAAVAVPPAVVWSRRPYGRAVTGLLRHPGVAGPLAALTAQATALVGVQFLMPFLLTRELDAGPGTVGVTMLAIPAGMILFGPVGGWLTDRWGAFRTAAAGVVVFTAGFAALLGMSADWRPIDLAAGLCVVGVGTGLFSGANSALTLWAAPPERLATASAAISVARQAGIAAGPAVANLVWSVTGQGWDGVRAAVAVAMVVGALGWWTMWRSARRQAALVTT
ncbi:MFS transporter [Stackebrandtia albiflava]|nr:MFS transporter [Stackebrandtia albiflava]